MAVSDSYIVQYLIQTTLTPDGSTVWEETDGVFCTSVRGVDVQLDNVPSRAGDHIYLTLTCEGRRAYIAEPPDLGLLSPKYANEDQRQLVALLRQLAKGVAQQCAARRVDASARPDESREWIFRRLLFDNEADHVDTAQSSQIRVA